MKGLNRVAERLSLLKCPITRNICFFVFMYLLGVVCILADPAVNKNITFLELFSDLYALCCLLLLLPRKGAATVKALLSLILYFLALVDAFLIGRLGAPITPTFVQMVLETDTSEATEAFDSYVTLSSISLPVMTIIALAATHAWCSWKSREAWPSFTARFTQVLIAVLLLSGLIFSIRPKKFMTMMYLGNHDTFIHMQAWRFYQPSKIFYLPIYKLLYSLKDWSFGQEALAELIGETWKCSVDSCSYSSPNIVLVIGESHNKHHSQLYGYNKCTTPLQASEQKKGNLIVFTDVITSYNVTTESFKNMFSLYCYGNTGSWSTYPLFPVLFRKAGYHTSFISNQFAQDLNANFSDFDVGMFFNNKEISHAQFDVRNTVRHEYDETLMADYDSLKQYDGKYNLHIFHLRGLHASYEMRYPEKWKKFRPSDYHRPDLNQQDLEVLAAYDNATRYNDYVLSQILHLFEGKDAVVVYVPDHGEVAFDGCQKFGRPQVFDANNLFQQFQIPFWIYMSDSYQAHHPEMAGKIRAAKDRPFMTDNLAQLLLGLAGISTKYYSSAADPLSTEFDGSRKRMIKGEYNYDDVMKGYKLTVAN